MVACGASPDVRSKVLSRNSRTHLHSDIAQTSAFISTVPPWPIVSFPQHQTAMASKCLRPLASLSAPLLRQQWAPAALRAKRCYAAPAVPPDHEALKKLPKMDASQLTIQKTESPKDILPPEELVFGRTFTGVCARLA